MFLCWAPSAPEVLPTRPWLQMDVFRSPKAPEKVRHWFMNYKWYDMYGEECSLYYIYIHSIQWICIYTYIIIYLYMCDLYMYEKIKECLTCCRRAGILYIIWYDWSRVRPNICNLNIEPWKRRDSLIKFPWNHPWQSSYSLVPQENVTSSKCHGRMVLPVVLAGVSGFSLDETPLLCWKIDWTQEKSM